MISIRLYGPADGQWSAALQIAKACPFLEVDGSLEVPELIHMSVQGQV